MRDFDPGVFRHRRPLAVVDSEVGLGGGSFNFVNFVSASKSSPSLLTFVAGYR